MASLLSWLLACTAPRPVLPTTERADPAQLEADVRALVEQFSPRDYTHPENLDRAAAFLAEAFTRAGATVEEQPYDVRGVVYRNVIARFGPTEGPRLVIGAHYDTCEPLPGADDNASGVAGLLALARSLGARPPTRPVELVAYSLEEPPFFRTAHMGSAVHARRSQEQGVSIRAMLSLEMLGYYRDEPGSQSFPLRLLGWFYPDRGNFIAVIGKLGQGHLARRIARLMRGASPLPVEVLVGPRAVEGLDFSDHLNYWDQGYPAVMITDTSFFRNPHYHTAQDTPDTLDYRRMAQAVDAVRAVIDAL